MSAGDTKLQCGSFLGIGFGRRPFRVIFSPRLGAGCFGKAETPIRNSDW